MMEVEEGNFRDACKSVQRLIKVAFSQEATVLSFYYASSVICKVDSIVT